MKKTNESIIFTGQEIRKLLEYLSHWRDALLSKKYHQTTGTLYKSNNAPDYLDVKQVINDSIEKEKAIEIFNRSFSCCCLGVVCVSNVKAPVFISDMNTSIPETRFKNYMEDQEAFELFHYFMTFVDPRVFYGFSHQIAVYTIKKEFNAAIVFKSNLYSLFTKLNDNLELSFADIAEVIEILASDIETMTRNVGDEMSVSFMLFRAPDYQILSYDETNRIK